MEMEMEYIAGGANRHPSCADWDGEVLAFGCGRNVAVWRPHGKDRSGSRGVHRLLSGHTDTVNAVRFFDAFSPLLGLITGSVDKTVRIWRSTSPTGEDFELVKTLHGHEGSVNCVAVEATQNLVATGSADCSVRIWTSPKFEALQTIKLQPRFIPLALAISPLGGTKGSCVMAVAGTAAIIQLYVLDASAEGMRFALRATLSGHEGWIRSLAFTQEMGKVGSLEETDVLLASASQDKYIRLWRLRQGRELPKIAATGDPSLGAFMPGKSLSNKAHRFTMLEKDYSATFEALLLGHEDWIYSAVWRPKGSTLQLLSASADNSLAIWEQDAASGVWVTVARLGEISAEKGSTTATGSTGGFWTGLWSSNGETVTCIGRTGSWRLWNYNASEDRWIPGIGVSGHIESVNGISWSRDGEYLLSTSADQTTRLHAQWKRNEKETGVKTSTWHEMARPQIHGYDLNCIDSLGSSSFVSGADEKLLRVFAEPKGVADILNALCGIENTHTGNMAEAANMPVLGLSNKAIEADEPDPPTTGDADISKTTALAIEHPPLEDQLSRQTLWPEIEKLYGHGYEISCLAASHDGSLIATACRASSIDHAVIRLFETVKWTEVKPPLSAHALTVTRLRFSDDDKCLLSVGRDRQWAVFERRAEGWEKVQADLKGHARMILDAAWLPGSGNGNGRRAFATAGRDKVVKLWARGVEGLFELKTTIKEDEPVTAVDFMGELGADGTAYLATGTETGRLVVYRINMEDLVVIEKYSVKKSSCPSKAITQLSWRPTPKNEKEKTVTNGVAALSVETDSQQQNQVQDVVEEPDLAVASEDCSLRIFSLKALLSASDPHPEKSSAVS